MTKTVRVWPDEEAGGRDQVRRTIVAEYFDGDRQVAEKRVFFELTATGAGQALPTVDWALVSILFGAMRWRRSIRIEGAISRKLAHNLDEFQMAFAAWLPKMRPVEIRASTEIESGPSATLRNHAVIAFSGGVDACFSAYRHIFKKPGFRHFELKTAMLVHGFDLPLDEPESFAIAHEGAQKILEGTNVELAVMRTNVRTLLPHGWSYTFGTALASCLHQFSYGHGIGLLGSDEPYSHLVLPWGSNPVTNPLLSSDFFELVTDGSGYTRTQKVGHLADWPAAKRYLRVCWEGPKTGKNCGRCEKCIRTILNFRAVGSDLPSAFEADVSDEQVARLTCKNKVQRDFLKDILKTARARGVTDSWVDALSKAVSQ